MNSVVGFDGSAVNPSSQTRTRVVFSVLHSESLAVLHMCIENFQIFASPGDLFVVNSSCPQAEGFVCDAPGVHVLKGQSRMAHGEDLLYGHVDNWRFASALLGDEPFLFVTLASNAMFFRPYDSALMIQAMQVPLTKDISQCQGWQQDVIRGNSSLLAALGSAYVHNQIEGFTVWGSDWVLIADALERLDYPSHQVSKNICLEEVLPLPVLAAHGRSCTNVCQMKWEPSRQGRRFVTLHDLFVSSVNLPDHVCAYKWFDRNPLSLVSRAVSDAALYESCQRFYGLLNVASLQTAEVLELGRSITDVLTLPRTVLDVGVCDFHLRADAAVNSRKTFRLNEGLSKSAFIYMEHLPDGFVADVAVQLSSTQVRVYSSSSSPHIKPNKDAYLDLKFFAVLYIPLPKGTRGVYLTDWVILDAQGQPRAEGTAFDNAELVLNSAVLEQGGQYTALLADASSFQSDVRKPLSFYDVSATAGQDRCFGVPVVSNARFGFSVRVI